MFSNIENLEVCNVIRGPSSLHRYYENRSTHAFVFKLSGTSLYTFRDSAMVLSAQDMLFLPKGTSYLVQRTSQEESEYVLINFLGDIPSPHPMLFSLSHQMDISHFKNRLNNLLFPESTSEHYRLLSLFYELLSYISQPAKTDYKTNSELQKLTPAIVHLKKQLFSPELAVSQLHRLCGISDTYFRQLFLSRFGTTPKKYILNRRLAHAQAILETGEYNSIAQVALLSGFNDPLYFSKAFKEHYGYPPSKEGLSQNVNCTPSSRQ